MKHDNALPIAVQNLRRIWESKKTEMQFNQVEAAKELGWSQGAISHYLNNITEMGPAAVIKLANFLNVDPTEIDPSVISKLPNVQRIEITRRSSDMTRAANETIYSRTDIPSIWVSIDSDTIIENFAYNENESNETAFFNSSYNKATKIRKDACVASHAGAWTLVNLCKPNLYPQNNYVGIRLKREKRLRIYDKQYPLPPTDKIHTMWAVISIVYN